MSVLSEDCDRSSPLEITQKYKRQMCKLTIYMQNLCMGAVSLLLGSFLGSYSILLDNI